MVRADTLEKVEPDNFREFWVRPYSLTAPELGGLPAVRASASTPVRARVRYPAVAEQAHGWALASTPRAVQAISLGGGFRSSRHRLVWVDRIGVVCHVSHRPPKNLGVQRKRPIFAVVRVALHSELAKGPEARNPRP
jgi:hypothetical protein